MRTREETTAKSLGKRSLWLWRPVLYFLMPIDVIPDVLIGLGFVDDAAVIAWVMNSVGPELGKFRQWETSRAQSASL